MTILMNIISVHSSLLMHDSIQDVIGSKVVSTPRCPKVLSIWVVPRSDSSRVKVQNSKYFHEWITGWVFIKIWLTNHWTQGRKYRSKGHDCDHSHDHENYFDFRLRSFFDKIKFLNLSVFESWKYFWIYFYFK